MCGVLLVICLKCRKITGNLHGLWGTIYRRCKHGTPTKWWIGWTHMVCHTPRLIVACLLQFFDFGLCLMPGFYEALPDDINETCRWNWCKQVCLQKLLTCGLDFQRLLCGPCVAPVQGKRNRRSCFVDCNVVFIQQNASQLVIWRDTLVLGAHVVLIASWKWREAASKPCFLYLHMV